MEINNISSYKLLVLAVIAFGALYFVQLENYLLFHILTEIFSIVIAFSVFLIVWNGRNYLKDNYLFILGFSYLFIGFMDLFHAIGYKGMNIFHGYDFYANQFWIASRSMEAFSLLLGTIFIKREKPPSVSIILIVYTVLSSAFIYSILFSNIFPECFIQGQGQTGFKIISEYVINTALAATLIILYFNKNYFSSDIYRCISISIVFTIISELSFTFYVDNYGVSNMVGHYAKIMSFYFIYRAVVRKSIINPYDSIFRELTVQREKLNNANILKTRLFSIISHDLKGPVSGLRGAAGILETDHRDMTEEDLSEIISEMHKSLESLSNLLAHLLEWAKLEMEGHKLRRHKCFVKNLLHDAVSSFKPSFELKKVGLELDTTEADDAFIIVDEDVFGIIIHNIFSNALKFSAPGTIVSVVSTLSDESVTVRIKDQGIGMNFDPEILRNMVNDTRPGTGGEKGAGLGLYMINKYTEENGGNLKIISSVGKGTEVLLRFPVYKETKI